MNIFVCAIKDKEKTQVELKIACVGEWRGHQAGSYKITQESLQSIKKNFDSSGIELVIDYEHQSLKGEASPAAGWIKSMEIKEDALFAKVQWNAKALEFIKNGEYKYLSPVFNFDYKNPKSGEASGVALHSVALTNTPFLDCLGEVKANSKIKGEDNMEELKERVETLQKENEALKKELQESKDLIANSVVENALVACKITDSQKEWALKYAKNDLQGFKEFLKTASAAQIPNSNLFANSKNPQKDYEVDVVKLALGGENE